MIDLNDIPENQTDLPPGVSEYVCEDRAQMTGFLDGFNWPINIVDKFSGDVFERDGKYVVRVYVHKW